MLVGHGSKTLGFDDAMQEVARSLRREKVNWKVTCAFLEAARPSIPDAIRQCVRQGAREVRLLPYFVLTGKHVTQDLPRLAKEAAQKFRSRAKIILCPYLGFDPKIVSVVKDRLNRIGVSP